MRSLDDEDDIATASVTGSTGQPAWMSTLKIQAEQWLQSLPSTLSEAAAHDGPLARFFLREVSTGSQLLRSVRRDLSDLIEVCENKRPQTNELRNLVTDLTRG